MTKFMAFCPPRTRKDGCEVADCLGEANRRYPTDRRLCSAHLLAWISPGFHGCGCGPDPCPACARHLGSGKRVLIVGERENRAGYKHNDEQHLANLRFRSDQQGADGVVEYLERAGALRWGSSRKRLLGLGLRWDNGINLLGPSGRTGWWDLRPARVVVRSAKVALTTRYDAVVLLGTKVAEAWEGESAELGPAAVLRLPHPSGRNRQWNDPAKVAECRAVVDGIYGGARWDT